MHPALVTIDIRRNALIESLIDAVAVLSWESKIRIWGNFCINIFSQPSGDHRTRESMADDELAAIRAARLKELQQQSGQVKSLSALLADYIGKQRGRCW